MTADKLPPLTDEEVGRFEMGLRMAIAEAKGDMGPSYEPNPRWAMWAESLLAAVDLRAEVERLRKHMADEIYKASMYAVNEAQERARFADAKCGDYWKMLHAAEARADAAEKERDDYRDANNSVAVCAGHIGEIVAGDGLKNGCFVCECDRLAAALREIAATPCNMKCDLQDGSHFGDCASVSDAVDIAAAAIAGEEKK